MSDLLQAQADAEEDVTLGVFRIGDRTVGIDVVDLSEVTHIQTLRPSLEQTDATLGLMAIRGVMIPVIDPLRTYHDRQQGPMIVAVLSHDGKATGLAVDEVLGLKRFPTQSVQKLAGQSNRSLLGGTICSENPWVQILDIRALFAQDGLPKSIVDLRKAMASDRSDKVPLLTFEAGGVFFAIDAATIAGTVPRQSVEDATMARDAFLGMIFYFGRRLPVLAANAVFGLGRQDLPERFETVVLRFPDDRLLGLAVEKILHVAYRDASEQKPLSRHVPCLARLTQASITLSKREHFVVDTEACRKDEALLAASGMSDPPHVGDPETPGDSRLEDGEIVREKRRFILLEAGSRIAVPMTDIDGMLPPPPEVDVIVADRRLCGLMGLFVVGGETIPLVRLSELLGSSPAPEESFERVFLTGDGDHKIGFLIDRVTGIAVSDWISRNDPAADDDNAFSSFQLGAMRAYGTVEIRNILDLRRTARELVSRFQIPDTETPFS